MQTVTRIPFASTSEVAREARAALETLATCCDDLVERVNDASEVDGAFVDHERSVYARAVLARMICLLERIGSEGTVIFEDASKGAA